MQKVKDVRSLVRVKNVQNILDILLKEDEVARVRLSEMTGLTKTTITSLTRSLIKKGIVEELTPVLNKKGVGRTVIPLTMKRDAAYTVGINLSRHSLSAIAIDTKGDVMLSKKGPSYGNIGPEKVIENLFNVLDDIFSSFPRKINAIGIGVPGPLNREKGIVIDPPKFYGWKNVPLSEIVKQRYEVPVWIENDANCAALAEKWYGSAKKIDSFLYVLLNEGIGMGIFTNGRIYKGFTNFEGELGHFVVSNGKTAVFLENHPVYEKAVNEVSHEKFCMETLQEVGQIIGAALASISNVLNPQCVFVGGKLTKGKEMLFDALSESFERYTLSKSWGGLTRLTVSKMEEAISVGGAAHALRNFLLAKAS